MTPRSLRYNCRNSLDKDHNVDNIYLRNSFCCVDELINENGSSIQEKIYEPSGWFEVSNNTWHFVEYQIVMISWLNRMSLSWACAKGDMVWDGKWCPFATFKSGDSVSAVILRFVLPLGKSALGEPSLQAAVNYREWVGVEDGSWRWELKGGFLLHASPV